MSVDVQARHSRGVTGVPGFESLRAWQKAALERYVEAGEPLDFLVTATPGAGKTTFALTFASWLLERGVIRRVIVVVPTDHLRAQWADAANRLGVYLDPSLSNDVGPVGEDFHGYVATYMQVGMKPLLHERRAETVPTLVIFDEIHHAGDGLTWGEGVREAFENVKKRLSLTGTPFRTSMKETIPFVRYVDDGVGNLQSEADYTYGYGQALADHVVRPVLFAAYSGVARWRNSAGDVIAAELGAVDNNKDEELNAWRTALDPSGEWIPHVIAAADQRLNEVRAAGMTDAGAMLLAGDQENAKAYAKIVQRVTGHKPVLVLSEDPRASEKIEAFAASRDPWLVSVRMVSEGVDIPRLAVGAWCTSYRTPLFFAQAVGRFVRARRRGETATVFLPAVRPLLALAAALETERDHILTPRRHEDDELLLEPIDAEPVQTEPSDESTFEALSAEAEFAHVVFGGEAVMGGDAMPSLSPDEADYLGLPGLLDPAQMATVLKQREDELRKRARAAADDTTPLPATPVLDEETMHRRVAALRKEINKMVNRIAMRTGRSHAQVHAQARAAVPGPPLPTASLSVLEARRAYLANKL